MGRRVNLQGKYDHPKVASEVRAELRRGATTISVTWPAATAAECAAWMRELLR